MAVQSSCDDNTVTTVMANPAKDPTHPQELSYTDVRLIDTGCFGVVHQAKLLGEQDELVAIKNVLQDAMIKLYMYQLFRSLAYIHSQGVCHRDIKPQNLLLDPESGVLKLCDFGSAKVLVQGEPNVAYICSRIYRAPELLFGATNYTVQIDTWSAGCVLAELLLGEPVYPGDSGVDQVVRIIKILGSPTKEQILEMNPDYTEFKFPKVKIYPWIKVFHSRTPAEAIELVGRLLVYTPRDRASPLQACAHAFFDELRDPNTKLPNGKDLPALFNFSAFELSIEPHLNARLIPPHARTEEMANAFSAMPDNPNGTIPSSGTGSDQRGATAGPSSSHV